jgi:hypothetical protein
VTNSESSGVAVRYNDGDGYDSDSMLDDNAEVIIPNRVSMHNVKTSFFESCSHFIFYDLLLL